jgi:hypothetical protein
VDGRVVSSDVVGVLLSAAGLPTVALKVKQVPFATLYTRPPDDGLQMDLKHVEAW